MNTQQTKKGFTIIEVVLVLAIAGLIFLMVFVALPALQRGQRDTQRRDDVSRVVSQLQSYATNNRGSLPDLSNATNRSSFLENYLKANVAEGGENGEFNDPKTGTPYSIITNASVDPAEGEMQYIRGNECSGENIGAAAGNNRQAAVRVKLEGSGFFCQNAQ